MELLRAFRRAFRTLDLPGRIIATDIDPLAPALQEADVRYMVPRYTAPHYVPALVEICRREQASLVFPLIDPDIPLLAAARDAFRQTAARPAVVSPEAAAIAADKWQTNRFFRSLGLPVPRAWLPGDLRGVSLDFPLFVKPRRGSAGKNTFRADNRQQLDFFLDYVPDAVVEELLPGPEITSDVISDLDGGILAVVSRRRIEVRWGEVAKGVTVYDPRITEACVQIARSLPAPGPINVQCLMKDGTPHFTEINARFGGGVPLAIAAGMDAPRWYLALAAGLPADPPPLGSYPTGLHLTRYDDSFFITQADVDRIASRRL